MHEWEFETTVVVRFRTDGERVWPVAAAPLAAYPGDSPSPQADGPDRGPGRFTARRATAVVVVSACMAIGWLAFSQPEKHAGSGAAVTSPGPVDSEVCAAAPELSAGTAGMDPDAYEHWLRDGLAGDSCTPGSTTTAAATPQGMAPR